MTESVAPQSPTTITTPDDATLVLERVFAAAPEVVFRAFTDPKALAQWYGPVGVKTEIHELDLRAGGKYALTMHGSDDYRLAGEYVEVTPPRRLSFTWRWVQDAPDMENETLVTLELDPHPRGTALRLTHTRFPTTESRGMHQEGWTSTLESLATFVG